MSKQYTVFTSYPDGYEGFLLRRGTLDDCVKSASQFVMHGSGIATPVAWSAEQPCDHHERAVLLEKSIAAGRLIEKTASGWVALGAEKQANTFVTVEQDLRDIQQILDGELREGEPTSADLAMIARDGPARSGWVLPAIVFGIDFAAVFPAAAAAAKPNPFPAFRSPDCDSGPSDHLNASRHQMAGMSKS